MKNLFKVTPGFAPDYSGVCSVLYELGGLCVMIDPGDCLEHSIYVDDPRWDEEPRLFFSPRLRELDAVVGDDDKLITKLLRAVRLLDPKFLALIGSPVPTENRNPMPELSHNGIEKLCGWRRDGISFSGKTVCGE